MIHSQFIRRLFKKGNVWLRAIFAFRGWAKDQFTAKSQNVEKNRSWGLYIHSPFCVHKCGYCDFNSWGETSIEPQKRWLEAILRQARYWSTQIPANSTFDTLFWGGGTPSLVDAELSSVFLRELESIFKFTANCEKTMEANPETLTAEKLKLFWKLGINRLSVGIQSFEDPFLLRLERHARRKDNLAALELVAKNWQGRWSLDLMFGLPEQTLQQWQCDLQTAMTFKPQHLSAYQLTLTTERSKNWKQSGDAGLLEFFDLTEKLLEAQGLSRYEVSNFAKPGHECLHNLKYWRVSPFLGLGPGASGLVASDDTDFGFHQKSPDNFDLWSQNAGLELFEKKSLSARSAKDDLHERLMMGLRLKKGIALKSLPQAFVTKLPSLLGSPAFNGYVEKNSQDFLRCAPDGLRILDSLLLNFFREI